MIDARSSGIAATASAADDIASGVDHVASAPDALKSAPDDADPVIAMRTMPNGRIDLIRFFEARLGAWSADPAAIGLSAQQLADLSAMVAAGRAALDDAEELRNLARAATLTFNDAVGDIRKAGGSALNTIRAFAEAGADPAAVYAAAQIPPRAQPSPAPAPQAPTDFAFTLLGDGALELRWSAPAPIPGAEVFTTIHRKLDGAGDFALLAGTGEESWTDRTIPAGTVSAQYMLRALRRGQVSPPSAITTVYFAAAPASATAAPRIAA
ncbi:MAG: hypothetical protein ACF8R7_12450 [Phycisphaerales bacterium JB039]